jgi:DNA repair ATPase RecN
MADVTNDPIYDVMKSMQGHLSNIDYKLVEIDGRLDSLTTQIRGVSMEMNAANGDIANIYKTLGRMDMRMKRIEKRLDIIEEPAE